MVDQYDFLLINIIYLSFRGGLEIPSEIIADFKLIV
jgi:hypothetical protein